MAFCPSKVICHDGDFFCTPLSNQFLSHIPASGCITGGTTSIISPYDLLLCPYDHTVVLLVCFFSLYSASLEHNFHSLEHSNQQNIELDGKEVVETEQCCSWGNIAVSEGTTLHNAGTDSFQIPVIMFIAHSFRYKGKSDSGVLDAMPFWNEHMVNDDLTTEEHFQHYLLC